MATPQEPIRNVVLDALVTRIAALVGPDANYWNTVKYAVRGARDMFTLPQYPAVSLVTLENEFTSAGVGGSQLPSGVAEDTLPVECVFALKSDDKTAERDGARMVSDLVKALVHPTLGFNEQLVSLPGGGQVQVRLTVTGSVVIVAGIQSPFVIGGVQSQLSYFFRDGDMTLPR